ncbi:MAG TPA: SDR family NAD(P)-dependent oxidoreductase [Candidatus Acidoferrales bacterium]|jgi:acyl transferase domain-containing protein/NADPH:quinone reductase-like Zn-dependent oxidoreductase/NAD(P)-dependent dehydrogenase (short-subunit alcohol dehydrogenase family)/acyl carrier protein|nr:SDR family NAD(P)-dependent oxidoreductase [Candidatus Acidoferrales bacterium]
MTSRDGIAIVGIGCRFPGGANNPAELWALLRDSVDAIAEVPADRWRVDSFYHPDPSRPGKTYSRWGGFIKHIEEFDAQFFGISPREAARADPQQRLLLEVAYEALEDAGFPPEKIAGSNTGVFVGISACEYSAMQSSQSDRQTIDAYTNIGSALSIAANRISYFFDLHGPSFAVDTACSSSLVAIHEACQRIWSRECDIALAGGVNSLLRPESTIGFSKASMLAHDGRCKSFDAYADGYSRAEGCGVIVLKPLSKAIADGDSIYAVIRGTAVNQDGRTPGISVPNGVAQEAILRVALQQSGIAARNVQYVEAHGTGTTVGDPIEATAIGNVLGRGRPANSPCLIGSVKSNIGHLEAGSGIAGIIKVALSIQRREIPGNLHFKKPNPKIPFQKLGLKVVSKLQPWPDTGKRPAVACVNSFGFGGTNAHVILGSAPASRERRVPKPRKAAAASRAYLLPLSARSADALKETARAYATFLSDRETGKKAELSDICCTASLRRGHHDQRLAVVAQSKAELVENLQAFAKGETRLSMSSGVKAAGKSHKLVFAFSGMGSQWLGMGRELLRQEPVFRNVLERCEAQLRKHASWRLLDELAADEPRSRIHEAEYAQPALFAFQAGLTALLDSWGIRPDAIVGHSVGEIAAAHAAGALSFEDAVQVIFHRSRLQQRTTGQGKMLAVGMSADQIELILSEQLAGDSASVSLAAINSPVSVTLSGDAGALARIAAPLEANGVFCRLLPVEIPYHSAQMDPLEAELRKSLRNIRPREAAIPLYSTVTGKRATGKELDAAYWWCNVRDAVLFGPAMEALVHSGHNLFIEVGPHPVLQANITECMNGTAAGAVFGTSRRNSPESTMVLSCLGRLYTAGYPVDWSRLFPKPGKVVKLPSYRWQHEKYWHESNQSRVDRLGEQAHPLLGSKGEGAQSSWTAELDKQQLPFLSDHRVEGAAIYPGAAYVEMAIAAAGETFGAGPCVVEDIEFRAAMILPDDQALFVQTLVDSQRSIDFYSRRTTEETWTRNAVGKIRRLNYTPALPEKALEQARERCTREMSVANCYRAFEGVGLQYGPAFRGIARLWAGEIEALGEIRATGAIPSAYHSHPAILDSCFQVLTGARSSKISEKHFVETMYLPVRIERVTFIAPLPAVVWCQARIVEQDAGYLTANFRIFDAAGELKMEIEGFKCKRVERHKENIDTFLFASKWILKPLSGPGDKRPDPDYLPNPRQIVDRLRPDTEQLIKQLDRKRFYDTTGQGDDLARVYVYEAFRKLGWKPQVGDRITVESFAARFHIAPAHWRLLGHIFDILADDGALQRVGEEWEVRELPEVPDSRVSWKKLWNTAPGAMAEYLLFRRCGMKLAEVLRGEVDPLQLIFPEGSLAGIEQVYADSPHYRIYNLLVQRALGHALQSMPADRIARVLEIGGGTGGLTVHVLPKLDPARTEYLFTDVTSLLVSRAEERFRDYPFVKYGTLDITADSLEQGIAPHSFDLILASDVLHATPDLRQTLAKVKQLLAPGGLLVMLEGTKASLWLVLVFGMLKGWWAFTDLKVRKSGPWVSPSAWQKLLREAGFSGAEFVADTENPDEALHSVVIAQTPKPQASPARARVTAPETQGTWLIFANDGNTASDLAELLRERGEMPLLVRHGEAFERTGEMSWTIRANHAEDMESLLTAAIGEEARFRGIVHLWSLDAPLAENTTGDSLMSSQWFGCLSVLHLMQVVVKRDVNDLPRVWLVTRGAQLVGDSKVQSASVAQAPLWGFARTVMNEFPALRAKLIDLGSGSNGEIVALHDELWSNDDETEVALRGKARYANRIVRTSLDHLQPVEKGAKNIRQPYRAEMKQPGLLESVTFVPHFRRALGPDEVEIEVHAASLNFKDIMLAMGLLPREPVPGDLTGEVLGFECAGKITAVGSGVKELAVGDDVIACGPGAVASHFVAKARNVLRKPASLSFEEGSSVLVAYLTAHYALTHLAALQKGERILIHAAAGGVGLAAIQIAQNIGAEVFATAGSNAKRDLLTALGVPHVMDSRTLAFASGIMESTNGYGVDVVLNSLGGEAIPRSLGLLAAGGRFVEIGKRDIYENNKLGLQPFSRSLSFFAVDLDKIRALRPEFARSMLLELMRQFDSGELHSLPYRAFPIDRVGTALRYMATAKHIGKVVLSLPEVEITPVPVPRKSVPVSGDATYVITGGFGGFGLAVMRWLVGHGARNLIVVSRSGASSDDARAALESMRSQGVTVADIAADVSDEQQLSAAVRSVAGTMPAIRGVIHMAMVMEDAPIPQMTPERMRKVMAPKIQGAWNLHELTRNLEMDFFVMFSSVATVLGGPGQSNYVAANAFMDSFAEYRRACGLPALTVSWGAVGDAGYVFENPVLMQKLAQAGAKAVPIKTLLKALEELLRRDVMYATVASMEWAKMSSRCHTITLPRFNQLFDATAAEPGAANEVSIADRVMNAAPEERVKVLQSCVREELAKVLGASPAKLDFDAPMISLGMDSLMAVALVNRIRAEVGVEVSPSKFMEGISISGMAAHVIEEMGVANKVAK